jgi:hypothetical protein
VRSRCRRAGLIWTVRATVFSFWPLLSRVAPSAPVSVEHDAQVDRLLDVEPGPACVQPVHDVTLESVERHDSL